MKTRYSACLRILFCLALLLGIVLAAGVAAYAAPASEVYFPDEYRSGHSYKAVNNGYVYRMQENGTWITLDDQESITYRDGVLTFNGDYYMPEGGGYAIDSENKYYADVYADGDLTICVDGNVYFDGGGIDAVKYYGIYVNGDLEIYNKTDSDSEITFSAGTASAETYGIWCNDLTVRRIGGDMTVNAYGNRPSSLNSNTTFRGRGIYAGSINIGEYTTFKAYGNSYIGTNSQAKYITVATPCRGVYSKGIEALDLTVGEGATLKAEACPISIDSNITVGTFESVGIDLMPNPFLLSGNVDAVGGDISWDGGDAQGRIHSYGLRSGSRVSIGYGGSLDAAGGNLTYISKRLAEAASYGIFDDYGNDWDIKSITGHSGTVTSKGYTKALKLSDDSNFVTGRILGVSTSKDGTGATETINGSITYADIVSNNYKFIQSDSTRLAVEMEGWTYGDTASMPNYTHHNVPVYFSYRGTKQNGSSYGPTSNNVDYSSGRPSDAGDYIVTISSPGKVSQEAAFSIAPRDLSSSSITFDFGEQDTYDGVSHSVKNVTVTSGDMVLSEGVDYTVTEGDFATNVEAKQLSITGIGNCTGSVTSTNSWSLQKKTPVKSDLTEPDITNKTYDGGPAAAVALPSPKSPKTGLGTGTVQYRIDGVYGTTIPTDAGTYDIQAVFAEGVNFAENTVYLGSLTISKAENPAVINTTAELFLGGKTIDLSENVTNAQGAVSYAITGEANGCSVSPEGVFTSGSATGNITVRVTVAGNDNYNGTTEDIAVTVKSKAASVLEVTHAGGQYSYDLPDPVFSSAGAVTEPLIEYEGNSVVYARQTAKPTAVGIYRVYVSYETDTVIYSGSTQFSITKAYLPNAEITLGTQALYDGSLHEINIDSIVLNGRTLVYGTDYYLSGDTTANLVVNKTVTVNGTGNYFGEKDITWSLRKADYTGEKTASGDVSRQCGTLYKIIDLPALPEGASYGTPEENSIFISDLILLDGGKVQFNAGTEGSAETATITVPVTGARNYNDYDVTVTVNRIDYPLTSIHIITPPTQTTYGVHLEFNPAGMVVRANYSDGGMREVTGYTWTPDGPLAMGTSSVTISYTENGVTKTADQTVAIQARDIRDAEIAFDAPAYNGTEQSLEFRVFYYGNLLTEGEDFTVTRGGSATDVGNVELVIAGKGDYMYNKTVNWSLSKATPMAADFNITPPAAIRVGETPVIVTPTLKDGKTGAGDITIYYYVNGEYTTAQPTSKGSYSVLFKNAGGQNYKAAEYYLSLGTLRINKGIYTGLTEFTGTFSSKGGTVDGRVELPAIPSGARYQISSNSGVTLTEKHLEGNVLVYSVTSVNPAGMTARVTIDVFDADDYEYYYLIVTLTSVDPEMTGISVKTPPSRTEYYSGEDFDRSGMQINIHYSDGSIGTDSITKFTFGPEAVDMTLGTTAITVSYTAGGITKTTTQAVTVKKRSLANATITINPGSQAIYDPSKIDQPIKISRVYWVIDGHSSKDLTLGTDYEIVSGDTATIVEEKTLVIRGIGDCEGTASTVWSLRKATPALYHFSSFFNANPLTSVKYDGNVHPVATPVSTLSGMGNVTAIYYNGSTALPKDAGTYTVTFDVGEGTNFSAKSGLNYGASNKLTITKASYTQNHFSDTVSARTGATDKTFTLPELPEGASYSNVTTGGIVTAANADGGTLTYSAAPSSGTGTGTITLSVTGAKNYLDYSISVVIYAKEAPLTGIVVTTPPTKTAYNIGDSFDKTGMVITASYEDGSNNTVSAYTVSPEIMTAETTSVTISYTEDEVTKTAVQAVTVGARPMASAVILLDANQNEYNGSAQNVKIASVTWGGDTLAEGRDYTITSGGTATDVGNVTLTITGTGAYAGTKTAVWSLVKATPTADHFDLPPIGSYTYNGSAVPAVAVPTLKSSYSKAGTVTVGYDGSSAIPPTNAGSHTVWFSVTEGDNFRSGTKIFFGTLEIEQAPNYATVQDTASVKTGNTLDMSRLITGGFTDTPTYTIISDDLGCEVSNVGFFSAGDETGTVRVLIEIPETPNYLGISKVVVVSITSSADVTYSRTSRRNALNSIDVTFNTETKKIEIEGSVSASVPVLIASYDENGRFIGVQIVTSEAAGLEAADGAEDVKVMWVDESFVPESESISLGIE